MIGNCKLIILHTPRSTGGKDARRRRRRRRRRKGEAGTPVIMGKVTPHPRTVICLRGITLHAASRGRYATRCLCLIGDGERARERERKKKFQSLYLLFFYCEVRMLVFIDRTLKAFLSSLIPSPHLSIRSPYPLPSAYKGRQRGVS